MLRALPSLPGMLRYRYEVIAGNETLFFCGNLSFEKFPGGKRLHTHWKPLLMFVFLGCRVAVFQVAVMASGSDFQLKSVITGTSQL